MTRSKHSKKGRIAVLVLLVAAAVATGPAVSASAMWHTDPVTFGCGAKIAQISWTNTGTVTLYEWPSNSTGGLGNYIRSYGPGTHTYNSGLHTWTYGFGNSPGEVQWPLSRQCVSYF